MRDVDKFPKKAGIYKLISSTSGKIYIGKSTNIYRRINAHKNSINRCGGYYLQNAIKKYGWDDFIVEILEIFENFNKLRDNEDLLKLESFYIKSFKSNDKQIGYNICTYSNDCTGIPRQKMSDETKEKLRIAHRGKKLSDKQKEILRQSHLGKKPTDEHKEKIRRANLGRKLNPEHVEKIRRASIGRVVSKETREKQRRAKLGNSIWLGKTHSEESKEKIRVANLGKSGFKHSQTSIEKMKMSKLGKVHSDQTKLKISQSKKGSKHNKVGVNNDDTIEYYGMLDNYLKDRGFSLNKDYLNLNFDKVGIFFEGSQIGDVSLRVSRNILHLRGLNFTNDNFKFVDVVYNFHLNQIMVKNLKVKIYTDIDNTIDSFKKTFKDFNLLKRCNKVTASPKKLWTTK